jgi:hypothetical protein
LSSTIKILSLSIFLTPEFEETISLSYSIFSDYKVSEVNRVNTVFEEERSSILKGRFSKVRYNGRAHKVQDVALPPGPAGQIFSANSAKGALT